MLGLESLSIHLSEATQNLTVSIVLGATLPRSAGSITRDRVVQIETVASELHINVPSCK